MADQTNPHRTCGARFSLTCTPTVRRIYTINHGRPVIEHVRRPTGASEEQSHHFYSRQEARSLAALLAEHVGLELKELEAERDLTTQRRSLMKPPTEDSLASGLSIVAAKAGYRLVPLGSGRLVSFAKTWPQYVAGTKTVTRRDSTPLKPGDVFTGVSCSPRTGRPYQRGPKSIVLSVRPVRLGDITPEDVDREGFPGRNPEWFVEMYCSPRPPNPYRRVFRVEFEQLSQQEVRP